MMMMIRTYSELQVCCLCNYNVRYGMHAKVRGSIASFRHFNEIFGTWWNDL